MKFFKNIIVLWSSICFLHVHKIYDMISWKNCINITTCIESFTWLSLMTSTTHKLDKEGVVRLQNNWYMEPWIMENIYTSEEPNSKIRADNVFNHVLSNTIRLHSIILSFYCKWPGNWPHTLFSSIIKHSYLIWWFASAEIGVLPFASG